MIISTIIPTSPLNTTGQKTLLKKDFVWQAPDTYCRRTPAFLVRPRSAVTRLGPSVANSFAVDLDLPKDSVQQVSFYFVDWDDFKNGRRSVTIDVEDGSTCKGLIHTTTVSEFGPGNYVKFLLSGKVRVVFSTKIPWVNGHP